MIAALALAAAGPSSADAQRVVVRYYEAIDRHDYRTAYAAWDRGGAASGQGYAAFAQGFTRTARVRVWAHRPVDAEGAAGSAFVTVPVEVRAVLADGTRQHFVGRYVLRRVNDVPGSTAEQRRWHLASARLRQVR